MKFKEALKIIEGLRFIADELTLMSALGRACLMDSCFITNRETLAREYGLLAKAIDTVTDERMKEAVGETERLLMQARDIRPTVSRLREGKVLDDVELFELKGLALLSIRLKETLPVAGLSHVESLAIPRLDKVMEILDPENTGNAHFHIYDAYSEDLAQKRCLLKKAQAEDSYDTEEADKILAECLAIEDNIRERLSEELQQFSHPLSDALEAIGRIDLWLAKGNFAKKYRLSLPVPAESSSRYTGLRYLPVEKKLNGLGKDFQPVDITLNEGVTLITGANMGGKTITLKSLAMAQAMFQFGFGVPSRDAALALVDAIALSIGDSQSAHEGLSSFGSEILKIDGILEAASSQKKMLILIDEPARTTNPEEGKAIVSAIIDILKGKQSVSVLTTHYSNITPDCMRLKVKGVRDSLPADRGEISPGSLTDYLDYSLIEDASPDVDREALTIARLLGISVNFSKAIENNLKP